jgi:hypothetical protein
MKDVKDQDTDEFLAKTFEIGKGSMRLKEK